ncbi:hypothetical protein [Brevundimonas sp.]|uniref:hypothetical protein n=1 Tax=Brevundimonas sp. TaxID=1871086 RepID=UPI00257B8845|nr:hypothetical protein [Brevundimonas sp.]
MIAAYVSIATAMGGFAGTAYVKHAEQDAARQEQAHERWDQKAQRDHEFRLKQCEWASTILGNANVPAALTERAAKVMSRCMEKDDV